MISGFNLSANVGVVVNCQFLARTWQLTIALWHQRFLQFRLGCHKLPIATGRRTGVARACRLCTFCDAGAVGDKKHLVFECAQLAPLRAKYADLFNDKDHTMRSFFAQRDHLRVLHYVIDCLNLMDR